MSARARLVTAGALSALAYVWLSYRDWHSGAAPVTSFLLVFAALFVVYAAAARWSRSVDGPNSILIIAAFAILFRVLLLFAGLPESGKIRALSADLGSGAAGYQTFLLYDNDVWRYLWDGHQVRHGINPYLTAPEAVEGGELEPILLDDDDAWEVYDRVAFPQYKTIYPPLAQLLFALSSTIAPGSVLVWKGLVALIDLLACIFLWRLLAACDIDQRVVLLYAWNPLVLKEFAGSGHVDALLVALTLACAWLLCTRRFRRGALAFALATAAKLSPLLLAGVVWRRTGRWFVAVPLAFALILAPFWDGLAIWYEALGAFARDWEFNAGPWGVIELVLALLGVERSVEIASYATVALTLALALGLTLKDPGDSRAMLIRFFLLLGVPPLISPVVMPWYLCWALPFAIALRFWPWIWLTALSMLSYLIYIDSLERVWWRALEFGGFAAAVAIWYWRTVRRKA